MKTNLFTLLLGLLPIIGFAQQPTPALLFTEQHNFLPITGGYGIGIDVDKPFARLHLNDKSTDGIALRLDMQDYVIPGTGNSIGKSLFAIQANSLDLSGVKIQTVFTVDRTGKISSGYSATQNSDQVSVNGPLTVYQSSNYSVGLSAAGLQPEISWRGLQSKNFRFRNINTSSVPLTLSQDGRVGVNTDDFFRDHNLYVDGSVYIKDDGEEVHSLWIEGSSIAEEMFVKIKDGTWGDYVFKDDYLLLPLNDLETFISKNGHLPEMPTAAEVEEEGVKTGETIRLLTVKVEELTLYLLQQQKEIEELKAKLDK